VGLVRVSIGLVDRRPATLGGRATDRLTDERGEVTGSIEIAIEHEAALIAAECPFGQAQFGFHHATTRTSLGIGVPPVRNVQPHTRPAGFVLHLDPAG
jgi:hypothetical protein